MIKSFYQCYFHPIELTGSLNENSFSVNFNDAKNIFMKQLGLLDANIIASVLPYLHVSHV